MRYILGFFVVLAAGNTAWTSEMSRVAGEPEYQAPSVTATAPVTQPAGSPVLPATSPAGAYQTATAQPTTPTMVSPGTYTVGTQPAATVASPAPYATYVTNSYPAQIGNRMGPMPMTTPVYYNPAMPGTATYGAPIQTYSFMPVAGQSYYAPVQRRFGFGLFQRRRQQFAPTYNSMPVYGTPVYGAPVYSTSGYPAATYAAPVYTTYSYSTPAYYTTPYASPATMQPTTGMAPTRAATPSTAPVYTPTMLDVPNTTPATGAAPSGAAPAEPPLQQGTTPASTVPAPPGAVQGTGATPARTTPAAPPIPRINPN